MHRYRRSPNGANPRRFLAVFTFLIILSGAISIRVAQNDLRIALLPIIDSFLTEASGRTS